MLTLLRGLSLLVLLLLVTMAQAVVTKTFTIQEPVGLAWTADRVNYPVEFPEGAVTPQGVTLCDAAGAPVAVQLSDVTYWPGKATVKSATLSFMASLRPNETATWRLTAGTEPVKQSATDLKVAQGKGAFELTTANVGIRLTAGAKQFKDGADAQAIPAPIQGLRLLNGQWIGQGWWTTDRPCLGYTCELVERGPVFARVKLRYAFTDRTAYEAIVELNAGAEIAQLREEFNLSEGKAYPMPEQPGEDKTALYRYVLPKFDNHGGAMLWDWWGGTHGKVTAPNGYQFAFYDGLAPDSLEWYAERPYASMAHEAAAPGDGGLKYPDDKRVISINAKMNWGEDECVTLGAYNSKDPAAGQVCIMGLRPSQWLNPDLDPHPIKTIKQFTQTNNMWLERQARPGLSLRVPTCLGKRMYGIGVLPRKDVTQKDGAGNETTVKGSDLAVRFIRLGRTRLDEVKDWVVYYDESAKYPRLTGAPGDLKALLNRVRNNGVTQNDSLNPAINYLAKPGPEAAKALIDGVTERCRGLLLPMLTGLVQDHNQYWMWSYNWTFNADVALGIPEITPDQKRELLRLIAAHAYLMSSRDFWPGRENGYGWGSINMPVQLRSGTALAASLVPNHPHSRGWREAMAKYFSAEILVRTNPAGASEEVGAYGGITINNTAYSLGALSRSDPGLDIRAAVERMKAVAHYRLQYLLPYDVRMGFRPAAPIGDSAYDGEGTLPALWFMLSATDPATAEQVAWGIRECGIKPEGGWTATSLLVDMTAKATVPPLASEAFPGAGMIMRTGPARPDETYVNINVGGYSFGHGHADRGCFILYAKGAPLMMDFGSQYQPSIRHTWNHPGGITFDHDESIRKLGGLTSPNSWFARFTSKPAKDYEIEPFTCLMPGMDPNATNFDEVFGRMVSFASLPAADYGVTEQRLTYMVRAPYMLTAIHGQQWMSEGSCSDPVFLKHPFTLTRRYVFVKSPDPRGPNYLVIRDSLPENTDLKAALNFMCLADKLEVNGQHATYTGQHGVDVDIYVAEPSQFQHVTHKVSQENPRSFGAFYEKAFGKPFQEEQTLFQIPQHPGGGFFTVLVPRQAGEPAPKFETALEGKAIRVTFAEGRVDTVVVMEKPGEVEVEGRKLAGTAFVVTKAADGTMTVTELAK